MAVQVKASSLVPYRVRIVGGTHYDEKLLNAWRAWCRDPEIPGMFKIRCRSLGYKAEWGDDREPVRTVMFSDPAMAVAFKIKWG